MLSLSVFILTTNGPSRLVYLGRELSASGVKSAIRIDGDIQPLAISAAYANFIDTVVQRFSGHRVYRADVSAPIDGGSSWQLGFLLAHWLLESSSFKLALEEEAADIDIFITGEVKDRPGLGQIDILPVNSIAEKLACAHYSCTQSLQKGRKVYLVFPDKNAADYDEYAKNVTFKEAEAECRLLFCRTFDELTDSLCDDQDRSSKNTRIGAGRSNRDATHKSYLKKPAVKLFAGLGVFAIVVGLYLFGELAPGIELSEVEAPFQSAESTKMNIYLASQSSDTSGIHVNLNQVVPEDRQNCSGNRFRNSPETMMPDLEPMRTSVVIEQGASVCGFSLTIENKLEKPVKAASALFRVNSEGLNDQSKIQQNDLQIIPPGTTSSIRLVLPRFRASNESWTIMSVYSAVDQDDQQDANMDIFLHPAQGAAVYQKHIFLKD